MIKKLDEIVDLLFYLYIIILMTRCVLKYNKISDIGNNTIGYRIIFFNFCFKKILKNLNYF